MKKNIFLKKMIKLSIFFSLLRWHITFMMMVMIYRFNSKESTQCVIFSFSAKILIVNNKKKRKIPLNFLNMHRHEANFISSRWWWSIREMKKKRCWTIDRPIDQSTDRPISEKNKIIIIWYDSSKIYGHFKNNFWKLLEKKERKHSKRITRKMLENIGISTILMLHLKEKMMIGWLVGKWKTEDFWKKNF